MRQDFASQGNKMTKYVCLFFSFFLAQGAVAQNGIHKPFQSTFSIAEQVDIRFSFKMHEPVDQKKRLSLILKVSPEGSSEYCTFTVSRFETPHAYNRSRGGVLFSSKDGSCKFPQHPRHQEIIKEIELLDMNFEITDKFMIHGNVSLRGIEFQYSGQFEIP
jgi:hypothetical protein